MAAKTGRASPLASFVLQAQKRQKLDEGLPGSPLITKFDLFSVGIVGTSTSSMASHSHRSRVVWVLQPQSPHYAGWRTHIARAGRSGEMFGGEVDKCQHLAM